MAAPPAPDAKRDDLAEAVAAAEAAHAGGLGMRESIARFFDTLDESDFWLHMLGGALLEQLRSDLRERR